jgi:formylmethanofuran dehydrogenase subunit E
MENKTPKRCASSTKNWAKWEIALPTRDLAEAPNGAHDAMQPERPGAHVTRCAQCGNPLLANRNAEAVCAACREKQAVDDTTARP